MGFSNMTSWLCTYLPIEMKSDKGFDSAPTPKRDAPDGVAGHVHRRIGGRAVRQGREAGERDQP